MKLYNNIDLLSTPTEKQHIINKKVLDDEVSKINAKLNLSLEKTIVCIVDDDGTNRTSDAYTGMTTWLNDQGIPMNFAICHDTIGTSGKYTVTEIQELQTKGNDILVHGNPKLTTLADETEVVEELQKAIKFHTDNNLTPTNVYVYPQGLNSDGTLTATQVKEIVGRYFDYGLNVNIASMSGGDTRGLWNKVPLIDKLNIARMEVSSTKGLDANKSKIDACIENKGLLILFTHSFMSQFTSGGYDEFKKIINYLLTKDVEFSTVSNALDKVEKIIKNYDDTQVKADIAKNKKDIADLDTNKQDKTDNALDTTDKTVVGAINEINGNALANATDLTSHTGDTDIHVTSGDKTKWNNVDNKVNKTDIIDNLTSTNTDKPLSAKQGKVLKGEVDLKANKTEVVKKTAITTTINSASTASQVPSAKAVYEKTKNMCTTSVADVGVNIITNFKTSTLTRELQWEVKNGICYITGWPIGSSVVKLNNVISSNMPKTSGTRTAPIIKDTTGEIVGLLFINTGTTVLKAHFYKADEGYVSLSYPVAES